METVAQRRESLIGYVNGVFRVGNLVERSLLNVPSSGLDFWVYESLKPELATASDYHSSRTRPSENGTAHVHAASGHAGLHKQIVLTLSERQWILLFSPAPSFCASHGRHYAAGTLIVGLLLTALLGGYLISMVRRSLGAASFSARLTKLNADLEQEIEDRIHAERALSTSEQKYRALVDHAPEAITVLDLEGGRFVGANQHAEQLFGMERDALLKTVPIALSPPPQPDGRSTDQAAHEYIQQAVEGDTPTFEWVHQNATGQEIPCEVRLIRLPDPEHILVRGTITDISARKRSEGLQKRLGRILDNSSNEIYILDAETLYFAQVNRGARDNLGYSMQELTALTPVDIQPHFTEQQFKNKLAPLRSGSQASVAFTTEHKRKDGTVYPVEAR